MNGRITDSALAPDATATAASETEAEAVTAILEARARELARPPEAKEALGQAFEAALFLMSSETYGLPVEDVHEVAPLANYAEIPGAPDFVIGVQNMRGRIVSILDLRRALNLRPGEPHSSSKVIVLSNETMEFGILVDEVLGVERLDRDALQVDLPTLSARGARWIEGIAPGGKIILDARKMLADETLIVNQSNPQ